MDFNQAPLRTRRDIAKLGMLHRAKLWLGHPQFREFFKPYYQQRNAYDDMNPLGMTHRLAWPPVQHLFAAVGFRLVEQGDWRHWAMMMPCSWYAVFEKPSR